MRNQTPIRVVAVASAVVLLACLLGVCSGAAELLITTQAASHGCCPHSGDAHHSATHAGCADSAFVKVDGPSVPSNDGAATLQLATALPGPHDGGGSIPRPRGGVKPASDDFIKNRNLRI
jgi:hypothetical protein